jgi:CspA family cold shock protein
MPTGKVKWFNAEKNYGFIEPDDGGDDLFLHGSNIQGSATKPRDGDRVEFDAEEGPKGLKATNVQILL